MMVINVLYLTFQHVFTTPGNEETSGVNIILNGNHVSILNGTLLYI